MTIDSRLTMIKWDKIHTITGTGSYYLLQYVDGALVAQIDKVSENKWELTIEYKHIVLKASSKIRIKLINEAGAFIALLKEHF